jgi:hypothetical protein
VSSADVGKKIVSSADVGKKIVSSADVGRVVVYVVVARDAAMVVGRVGKDVVMVGLGIVNVRKVSTCDINNNNNN